MKPSGRFGRIVLILGILATGALLTATAQARDKSYWILYDFGHEESDGVQPEGVPAVAKNGDLYGVTASGGSYNDGTAFRLTAPKTRGGAWKKTILYDFSDENGGGLPTSLMFGADDNLYGADYSDNIFELSAPKSGDDPWKYDLLYTLNGTTDGVGIEGMVLDAKGNIYGATQEGGDSGCDGGCGTVFELKRPTKKGGKWSFSVLHTFTGKPDGAQPFAGVTLDQNGNVYGTTFTGGAMGNGSVYRLTPPAKKGQPWTETVLYSFDPMGNIGTGPESPLIFDSAGNLYGTTEFGGDLNCSGGFGCGVVYEVSPPVKRGESWSYTTLYAFQGGNDGAVPLGSIVSDRSGNLYGTTEAGGKTNGGTAYRLSPPGNGEAWTESTLHAFGNNGTSILPEGLTWGKWDDLYGVTEDGGTGCEAGCGTAFEIKP